MIKTLISTFLIVGYNNTRIYDVQKIRGILQEDHGIQTTLITPKVSPLDIQSSDFVIESDLVSNRESIANIQKFLKDNDLQVSGVLPFSDKGTQLGAGIANELGLPGHNVFKIAAALDKFEFRQAEQREGNYPPGYRPIKCEKVGSLDHLMGIFKSSYASSLFLKPSSEGNSRGCLHVKSIDEVRAAYSENQLYVSNGLIAEEYIPASREYSVDHVNGNIWVTEKKTSIGKYRVEYQQIVPAPLSPEDTRRLIDAGVYMGRISGWQGGAFHNELFFNSMSKEIFGVEPNLRPAGMHIWDLAKLAFTDFDPWREWVSSALQKNVISVVGKKKELFRNKFAGIRMLKSPKDGVILGIRDFDTNSDLIEVRISKSINDLVSSTPKDNSEFLGHIIATHENYEDLVKILDSESERIEQSFDIGN